MPGPYTSSQKQAIQEFQNFTQADKSSAAKLLKQHNWNVNAAVNAHFSNPANGATNPIRQTMSKVFDKYRDDPKNEPDEIGPDGTSTILGEMDIGLDDIGAFVFQDLVQSPSLGKITREGFLDAAADAGADSIPKLRNVILQRRSQLDSDRNLFSNTYNHAFQLGLANNQKSLSLEVAKEFWMLLFSSSGFEWRSRNTPWLDWWLEYMDEKWNKAINRDLWRQTLRFARETMQDESLGFWNEESSWPSVVDDFVEWVKTEKRANGANLGAEDAMDVE